MRGRRLQSTDSERYRCRETPALHT